MKSGPKRGVNVKVVVLLVSGLVVAAGVLSSTALGQTREGVTVAAGQVQMLDPFMLRMVTLDEWTSALNETAALELRVESSAAWRPVRIPARLPERSAFRPDYTAR